MKKIKNYIAIDGVLHILMSIILVLILQPIIGYLSSALIALLIGILKECYDYFIQKDNNKKQVIHDLICDIIGVIIASLVILLWQLV